MRWFNAVARELFLFHFAEPGVGILSSNAVPNPDYRCEATARTFLGPTRGVLLAHHAVATP
ncbi:MAG TPA: hypothetical protein PKC22_16870, partial [Rhodocyclaceae bacterium]|nr:hypothetical protein [Rhodocyclaceae bacterium]